MIKLNSNTRPVRQCMADFSFMDGGEFKTEPTPVVYYTLTIKEIRENRAKTDAEQAALDAKREAYTAEALKEKGTSEEDAKAKAEARLIAENIANPATDLSTVLAARLHSLPDLVDDESKPLVITPELLETIDLVNLKSIQDAIDADLSPKLTPAA